MSQLITCIVLQVLRKLDHIVRKMSKKTKVNWRPSYKTIWRETFLKHQIYQKDITKPKQMCAISNVINKVDTKTADEIVVF